MEELWWLGRQEFSTSLALWLLLQVDYFLGSSKFIFCDKIENAVYAKVYIFHRTIGLVSFYI